MDDIIVVSSDAIADISDTKSDISVNFIYPVYSDLFYLVDYLALPIYY